MSGPGTAAGERPAWPAEDLEAVERCPVCGGVGRTLLHGALEDRILDSPGRWDLWRCAACASGYLDPRPSARSLGRAYEGDYVTHAAPLDPPAGSALARVRRAVLADHLNARYGYRRRPAVRGGRLALRLFPGRRIATDRWIRHLSVPPQGNGRLLDLGAGNGEFLLQMRDLGWEVHGTDTDPAAIAEASRAGVPVRLGTVEAIDPAAERFDAITLGHVIEHLADPLATMTHARRLLEPSGMVWIGTPNIESLAHRRFGRSWFGLDPPRHLVLFNGQSLLRLLSAAGFERAALLRPGTDTRWLFGPSLAIERGLHPLREVPPLPPGERARVMVAELASRSGPQHAEEVLAAAWTAAKG